MKLLTQFIIFVTLISAPAQMLEANDITTTQEYVLQTGTKKESATVQFPCEPVSRYDEDMKINQFRSLHYNVAYVVAVFPLSNIKEYLDDYNPKTFPKRTDANYKEAVLLALFDDDTDGWVDIWFDVLRYKEFVDQHGYLALEWTVDSSDGDVEKNRAIVTDNNVYLMFMTCDKSMESRGDFFFDSLKIEGN